MYVCMYIYKYIVAQAHAIPVFISGLEGAWRRRRQAAYSGGLLTEGISVGMITLRASAAAALEVRVRSKVCPRPVAAPPARGTGAGRGTIATTCERFNCERFHCDRPAAPSRPAP